MQCLDAQSTEEGASQALEAQEDRFAKSCCSGTKGMSDNI